MLRLSFTSFWDGVISKLADAESTARPVLTLLRGISKVLQACNCCLLVGIVALAPVRTPTAKTDF